MHNKYVWISNILYLNSPVILQSCQRTVELSRSQRRSYVARVHLWSARVTVVTPLCMSAGIATPACPWWTLALLWRYQTVFVFLNLLSKHHISVSALELVAVEFSLCFCPVCTFCPGLLPYRQRTIESMSFVLLLFSCLCFWPFSLLSPSLLPFVSLSFSLSTSVCLR